MAKRSKAPTNLGQGIPRVGGELVDRLNKLDEGLGTALAYELNHRFSLADVRSRAAAGHAGTVVIAEQPRDSVGNKAAAIDVSGGNVAGSGWATQGDHLTPLSQVRSLFTCDHFGGHPSGFPGWFEECVQAERQAVAPFVPIPGILHAFYGYTYDIPSRTFGGSPSGDPGQGEIGIGHYWQFMIDAPTTVDRVTWYRTSVIDSNPGSLRFGLYDMNTAIDTFGRLVETDTIVASTTTANTAYTMDLDSRIDLAPGMYALGYIAPCFHNMLVINADVPAERMVNQAYSGLGHFPRYGAFHTTDGVLPAELNSGNMLTFTQIETAALHSIVVPLTYWSDSGEFG